jgi:hypothetical protein
VSQAPRHGAPRALASSDAGFPGRTPLEIGLPPPPPGAPRTRVANAQPAPLSPISPQPTVAPPARLAPMSPLDRLLLNGEFVPKH